jgi:hypothetical protein
VSSKGSDPNQNKANLAVAANPLGTVQGDAIRNITGAVNGPGLIGTNGYEVLQGAFYDATNTAKVIVTQYNFSITDSHALGIDSSRLVPIANENRPANYAVNYYIKY